MPQKSSETKKSSPGASEWRPVGVSHLLAGKNVLSQEEYEALRAVDLEGTDPSRAAESFRLTPQRFSALLRGARKKIAEAITNGKSIVIGEGETRSGDARYRCGTCGNVWTSKDPVDLEDTLCPRCGGTRIIDLSTIGDTQGFYRR